MKLTILSLGITVAILVACNNNPYVAQLEQERDSLQRVTLIQDSTIARIDGYIDLIAESLDSIRTAENILTVRVDENGKKLSRQQIKQNLDLLEQLILRQRERISSLELELYNQKDSTSNYRTLITYLYTQLDQKDEEISQMRAELNAARSNSRALQSMVDDLRTENNSLSNQISEQESVMQMQEEVLTVQSAMLNKGYVRIGTKKELSADGLIEDKFLSSTKANYDNFTQSKFTEVDIRNFKEITLNNKKAKVLTNHPKSSYTIKKNGSTCVLTIINADAFWSASQFLVILL